MENPETWETMDTDTERRQKKQTNKVKRLSNTRNQKL